MTSQLQIRALTALFGVSMVGAAAVGSPGPALIVAVGALLFVALGVAFRPAATLAVLASVMLIVAADPRPVFAALAGLYATAYLVCRHAAGTHVGVLASWPTIVAAVGFTLVGLLAVSFPLQLPWLPLIAPLAVLAIYVLATRPFLNSP